MKVCAGMMVVTKSQLADYLGVTRGRVSQYIAQGMPVMLDGRVHFEATLHWIRRNIGQWNNKWHDRGRNALR